jgi:hypothetical protein
MLQCAVCGRSFDDSDLLFSEAGRVCEGCHAEAELPDVGRLLRIDSLKLGLTLTIIGMVAIAFGLGVTIWSWRAAVRNPFIETTYVLWQPVAVGVAFLGVGLGSLGRALLGKRAAPR